MTYSIFDMLNDQEDAERLKGLAAETDPNLAWEKYQDQPEELRKREHLWVKSAEHACRYALDVIKDPWPPGEKAIASDPYWAFIYAADVIGGPWPPGEKAIASDAGYAYLYARYVITKPWPPGEKAIASDPYYAYDYARHVIKGPWPPGEKAIASHPDYKKQYEKHFGVKLTESIFDLIKDREDAERLKSLATEVDPNLAWKVYRNQPEELRKRKHLFVKDPANAARYATHIARGPFPEGEDAIATSAYHSYQYARTIDGPFPAGEKAIATNAQYSLWYAVGVIKKPWPPGEAAILTDPKHTYDYMTSLKKNWPEGLKVVASDPGTAFDYANTVIGGAWPPGEKAIASDPITAGQYALHVTLRRWPAAEKVIARDSPIWHIYRKRFGLV